MLSADWLSPADDASPAAAAESTAAAAAASADALSIIFQLTGEVIG